MHTPAHGRHNRNDDFDFCRVHRPPAEKEENGVCIGYRGNGNLETIAGTGNWLDHAISFWEQHS